MTEKLTLRDYQREAIDAVFAAWEDGLTRPAIVLPTGAGKTVVFSSLVKRWREWAALPPRPTPVSAGARGDRVIVLVHRDELADQAIEKLRSIAPDLSVGKVKANQDQTNADVMVCSVQTLVVERRRKRLHDDQKLFGAVGLIITDECHHAAAESYQQVYAAFPDALQLGVTATMARGDGVGLGSTWEEVVFSRSILWMISKGYLSDVKAQRVTVEGMALDAVKKSRGDYQAGDLGRAMEESGAQHAIARAYREHAADRPGIVFTPTVATAHAAADELNEHGIPAAVVSGETPKEERHRLFSDFRTGQVQALVNCMVLTEGFDAPWASCAVIARPTQSQPLYVQMVGRVLRPYPGKTDALVLDMAGTGGRLCTLVDLEQGSVMNVRPEETLADAVVREAEEADQVPPSGSVAFALKNREISLFAGSDKVWLRTLKGVPFLSCGDETVFLWPTQDGGGFDVCVASPGQKWKRTTHTGLDVGSALAWGEAVAEDRSQFSLHKSASWRKAKPSDKQVGLAERLGISGAASMRRGELSEAIDIVFKSRMFDRYAL
jgi:superfamily II DNA or RNA helicase